MPSLLLPEQKPAWAIPPGYGLHRLASRDLASRNSLLDILQVWQHPRKGHRYVLGADVGDGLGKDRSVVDVIRLATIEEPEEEVAQFVTDSLDTKAFAYVVQTIGQMYRWPDGREALAAIEINNHGMGVQDMLQLHLGYRHFYVWEVVDQADPAKRFTTRIGWVTTPKTRPLLLGNFYAAVTTTDPISGYADLRLNSPFTLDEMRDFQTDGALWEAEAARGAHDDCLIACAIAHTVAWRLLGGESEPTADRRRRRQEEELRRLRQGVVDRLDFRNSDATAEEQKAQEAAPGDLLEAAQQQEEQDEEWFYDPDSRGYAGTLY